MCAARVVPCIVLPNQGTPGRQDEVDPALNQALKVGPLMVGAGLSQFTVNDEDAIPHAAERDRTVAQPELSPRAFCVRHHLARASLMSRFPRMGFVT